MIKVTFVRRLNRKTFVRTFNTVNEMFDWYIKTYPSLHFANFSKELNKSQRVSFLHKLDSYHRKLYKGF